MGCTVGKTATLLKPAEVEEKRATNIMYVKIPPLQNALQHFTGVAPGLSL